MIDTLDYIIENASTEKILLYLLCHVQMMGFTIPDTKINWYAPDQITEMIQHIDKLYPLIRKYLHILDDTIYTNYPKYVLEDGKKIHHTLFLKVIYATIYIFKNINLSSHGIPTCCRRIINIYNGCTS